jgi:4-hydroxy-3-polyprenylbenzoate decarboxylase
VGVTGASGAIYAVRLLRALLDARVPVDLVFTEYGLYLLKLELGLRTVTASNLESLRAHLDVPEERWSLVRVFRNHDLAADPASGSTRFRGVVVCPCSMKNVAAIAQGLSETLLQRAADVALKERRPLVLVPRETPLHLIHLENLARISRAGGTIIPAMPAFYQGPKTFEDLADFIAQRVLDHVGVEARLVPAWSERERARPADAAGSSRDARRAGTTGGPEKRSADRGDD